MKIKKIYLFALFLLFGSFAHAGDYNSVLLEDKTLAYSINKDLNISGLSTLSFQTVYSSSPIKSLDFSSGKVSSCSFIISNNNLGSSTASVNVQVRAYSTAAANSFQNWIEIDGVKLYQGVHFQVVESDTQTFANVAVSINNYIPTVTCSTTSNIGNAAINIFTKKAGKLMNSKTVKIKPSCEYGQIFLLGGCESVKNFDGGRDTTTIKINQYPLVPGKDYAIGATSTHTAVNLSSAINNNFNLNKIVLASATSNYVVVTSSQINKNSYTLLSSNHNEIDISSSNFIGGEASKVSNDKIYWQNHGLSSGVDVIYSTSSGATFTNLTNKTTYYVIRVDPNNIKLSRTSTGSLANIPISLSTPTANNTFNVTMCNLLGTPGGKWQGSNDGSNFYDLNVASFTYTGTSGNSLVDLPTTTKFIRLKYTTGTSGSMNIKSTGYGR